MKFKIPENFNDLSLRDIFQQLKVPKKDLHHLSAYWRRCICSNHR